LENGRLLGSAQTASTCSRGVAVARRVEALMPVTRAIAVAAPTSHQREKT